MKFIKKIFSAQSNEKKYKNEILPFLILTIFYILLCFILNTFKGTNIILFIIYVVFLYQLVLFFIRLTYVSDNKEIYKYKTGDIKFKFTSIKISINEIILWLESSKIPDILYVKSTLGNRYIIEVGFETNKVRGEFVNKTIWFDDIKINSIGCFKELIKINQLLDFNDCIEVEAITEFNDPKLFYNIIKDINCD